jgi:glycosyltransferase involved in cell wall biosynthesis
MTEFDILFVADPRFPGGTSTGVASEIAAAHAAGFRCGLLMVKGPVLRAPHPIHPQILDHLDTGRVASADPDSALVAGVTIVHHPTIFSNLPVKRLSVRTGTVLLVIPHPEVNSAGEVQYDLPRVAGNIEAVFGVAPTIAPAGVNVRRSFQAQSIADRNVLSEDWRYLIDLDLWPVRPIRTIGEHVVIGRHSRPDPAKWPDALDEALAVYPADTRYEVRILGGGVPEGYGTLPANWSVLPFTTGGVSGFLQGLDFYVYFHSSAWVEAFGRTILEAMATGLVIILPPSFEPQFGTAAVYAEPHAVNALIEAFVADPERYRRQCRHARQEAERLYGLGSYRQQIAAIAPEVKPARNLVPAGPPPSLKQRTVLFFSSNGIGLGHLTRQMALARRMSPAIKPVFVTMSHAFRLVLDHGYHGEFLPFHRGLGADPTRWNEFLAEELHEILAFYRPAALVFDGNNPYPGMLDALATRPEMLSFWVRRPMWRQRHELGLLRAGEFDFVIEPGEIAEQFDRGPTRLVSRWAYRVGPICYLEASELLDRDTARRELGIPDDHIAVCVQLGSGNNFDMSAVRAAVLDALLRRDRTVVVELRSPIKDTEESDAALGDRHHIVETYPSSRYLNAFDFSVSAAGYNSFHENLGAALPTLFVPNEADEMDLQLARARYADLTGLGRMLRRDDSYAVGSAVEEMFDAEVRGEIARRCVRSRRANGAVEAARFIEQGTQFVRTDFDIADVDFGAAAR